MTVVLKDETEWENLICFGSVFQSVARFFALLDKGRSTSTPHDVHGVKTDLVCRGKRLPGKISSLDFVDVYTGSSP